MCYKNLSNIKKFLNLDYSINVELCMIPARRATDLFKILLNTIEVLHKGQKSEVFV